MADEKLKLPINEIVCGDCLEVMKGWPDNCVDLVLTDPPYQFEPHGRGISGERAYLHTGCKEIGVKPDLDLYSDGKLLECLFRVLKKVNLFIFCNKAQILDLLLAARERKYNAELLALCKTAPLPCANNQWLPDREWGIHIFKSLPVLGDYSTKRGFFIDSNYQQLDINHPTPKPLYMMKKLLENLSVEASIVLDCFSGSGTTCVAAKMLGRNYIGIDISPEYVEISRQRIKAIETCVPVKEQRQGQMPLFE